MYNFCFIAASLIRRGTFLSAICILIIIVTLCRHGNTITTDIEGRVRAYVSIILYVLSQLLPAICCVY